MERVEECAAGEEVCWDVGGVRSLALRLGLHSRQRDVIAKGRKSPLTQQHVEEQDEQPTLSPESPDSAVIATNSAQTLQTFLRHRYPQLVPPPPPASFPAPALVKPWLDSAAYHSM